MTMNGHKWISDAMLMASTDTWVSPLSYQTQNAQDMTLVVPEMFENAFKIEKMILRDRDSPGERLTETDFLKINSLGVKLCCIQAI